LKFKIIERELLNPLAEIDTQKIESNPIPKDINTLALIDNTKPNSGLILDNISKKIDYNKLIKIKKPAGAPATKEQINNASPIDLSILALGDCGSCTTWLVLDAIKLEKQGTPTISICTDVFAPYAHQLASSYGATQLKIVEIKHPIAGQSREIIENRSEKVIVQIKKLIN